MSTGDLDLSHDPEEVHLRKALDSFSAENDRLRAENEVLKRFGRFDYKNFIAWLTEPNRNPANVAFSSGHERDAAFAVEDSGILKQIAILREALAGVLDATREYMKEQYGVDFDTYLAAREAQAKGEGRVTMEEAIKLLRNPR